MSVKQFELFLVENFLNTASKAIKPGYRYQFKSPDYTNSKRLYDALVEKCDGNIFTADDIELPYIEHAGYKIIPVLHSEDQESVGFTENYISRLRDEVASQEDKLKGAALIVIHNSLLDTLINSADDLAEPSMAWSLVNIKNALSDLINEISKTKDVSLCLLDEQYNAIVNDGATMFGFEPLFYATQNGKLCFPELGMFNDPLVLEMTNNKAQIKNRLQENQNLYNEIQFEVEHYGHQLEERLKDYSPNFIKENFSDNKWKEINYEAYIQEIKKNKIQHLKHDDETEINGSEVIGRYKSESRAGMRERHLIINLNAHQDVLDLKINFSGVDNLEKKQIKVMPEKVFDNDELISCRNNVKNSSVYLKAKITESITYFTIALKRDNSTENHQIKCLVLKKGLFHVDSLRNIFLVDVNKQRLTLKTDVDNIIINNEVETVFCVETDSDAIDNALYGKVDFSALVNESDEINFKIKSLNDFLNIKIEGAPAEDSLELPLLLNRSRFHKLFDDGYYGELSSTRDKVTIDNTEYSVHFSKIKYLRWEAQIINSEMISYLGNESVSLNSIKEIDLSIYLSYKAIFNYLKDKRTCLSLVSWGEEFRQLVDACISSILEFYNNIPIGDMLTPSQKIILQIGLVKDEEYEYYSPFHPIIMSYYSYIAKEMSKDSSFDELPNVTFNRLGAQGLLPYVYHPVYNFAYNQNVAENKFWMRSVPQQKSSLDFVKKVVREKITEFKNSFCTLFQNSENTIMINSINQEDAEYLFLGLVDYVCHNPDSETSFHINFYDDNIIYNSFDKFSEATKYQDVIKWLSLDKGSLREQADAIIDFLRANVTYSKFTNSHAETHGQAYAHISFFRNNEDVELRQINIDDMASGIACEGLLAGDASQSKHGSYFTAFGLQHVDYSNCEHLKIAKSVGSLLEPVLKASTPYTGANAPSLAVSETFKAVLKRSYDSSIWTTIIDPKVTLEFFHSNTDVVLIHYSDQYTTSSSYDAITVTAQRELFLDIIKNSGGGHVDELNAFNGDWLLKMITCGPTIQKERLGIIGAYKFVSCLLKNSDITWIPLSVAEMIRVSGNIGLKISESDFSRGTHGNHKGVISDDILFVGFKDDALYLLPVEVKTGSTPDYNKAVQQALSLKEYLFGLLGENNIASKIYRSLFVRQVLIQIDKYKLYGVFDSVYFDSFLNAKERWLDGNYKLCSLVNYPAGIVVSHLDSKSCFEPTFNLQDSVLKIDLPISLLQNLVKNPLNVLLHEKNISDIFQVPSTYMLGSDKNKLINDANEHHYDASSETVVSKVIESNGNLAQNSQNQGRVEIGCDVLTGDSVYWEYLNPDLGNRHLIIFGSSGQGKTYCIQGLLMSLSDSGVRSLIIDYTNGFLPNQVEPEFINKLNPISNILCNEPFEMSPFRAQHQDISGIHIHEKPHTVAGRIASVFNKVYSTIGEKQLAILIDIIEHGVKTYGANYSFEDMYNDLLAEESVGPVLASKIAPLIKSNLFSSSLTNSWEKIFGDGDNSSTIMQLVSLSNDISMLCTEFMLWDLYFYARNNGNVSKPLPIVLDEVQNLDQRLDSPLGKMLTEGRKFGISLILATQTLSTLKKDEQDRLFQASHKLFFAPAKTEIKSYAKILEMTIPGSKSQEWEIRLSELNKGQCLSVGYHQQKDGSLKISVKKVNVTPMSKR